MQQDWALARQQAALDSPVTTKATPRRLAHRHRRQRLENDSEDIEMMEMKTSDPIPQYPSHWTWDSPITTKATPRRLAHRHRRQRLENDSEDVEMMEMETSDPIPQYPSHWTWSSSSECPPELPRRYHLIVLHSGPEFDEVSKPLRDVGLQPKCVKRVQNLLLYKRLQLERKLMEESHPAGWNVNERSLFHVTSVEQEVIADEGLDLRLSRQGMFGTGIYFRLVVLRLFH